VVRHINSCKRAGDKASLVLDVSLDCNINDNRSFIDLIPDPQGTQEEIVSSEQELERKRLMLKESLANLKKVERNVIVARYGGERIKTLSSVAHKLGMSTEGVRKTEMRAIQKLKEMMAGREL
jgi:RNA polymerase sigma factor (sigma-70 family)